MDKKSFVSTKDLCKIISTCSKSNVRSISFWGIKLEFGQENQLVQQPLDEIQTRSFETKSQQIVKEVEEQERRIAREAELENLKLLDPLAWERLQFEGEHGEGESP